MSNSNFNGPLVSIIIPTFNRVNMLKEALASVFSQTLTNFEVIIVDNLSSDGTGNYIESLNEPRIRYFRNPNNGVIAVNRNFGIRKAKGVYIAFLDSDDVWASNKLELQTHYLQQNPALGWVFSAFDKFNSTTGQVIESVCTQPHPSRGWLCGELIRGNFVATSTVLIKLEALNAVGLFNESRSFLRREDWELWLRLAARYQGGKINKMLCHYRVHDTNETSADTPMATFYSLQKVVNAAIAFAPEAYLKYRPQAMATVFLIRGELFAKNGALAYARRSFRQAIKLCPHNLKAWIWLILAFGGASCLRWQMFLKTAGVKSDLSGVPQYSKRYFSDR